MTLIFSQGGTSMFRTLFPNKSIPLRRLNTNGLVAMVMIAFLLPGGALAAPVKQRTFASPRQPLQPW